MTDQKPTQKATRAKRVLPTQRPERAAMETFICSNCGLKCSCIFQVEGRSLCGDCLVATRRVPGSLVCVQCSAPISYKNMKPLPRSQSVYVYVCKNGHESTDFAPSSSPAQPEQPERCLLTLVTNDDGEMRDTVLTRLAALRADLLAATEALREIVNESDGPINLNSCRIAAAALQKIGGKL